MKLLVTGGSGFIGSHFIRHVLRERRAARVVNFDVLSYAANLENLVDVANDPRYRFLKGDISRTEAVEACFREEGFDGVVNFAAETHVDRSILDSTAFIRTNVLGTQVLLEAARRHGVRRFIQISTDEVYGSLGEEGTFTEETRLAPNSPYAASKAGADLLVQAYHHTYGLNAIVTRSSNNYGPHQFPEKLIPLMIVNALEDRPLPVYGDGLHTRDWIHVLDHCSALVKALEHGQPGRVYNIGGNQERKNLEVVRAILTLVQKPEGLIQFVPDRPGHDRRYAIDTSHIRQELGWAPRISFEEGLAQTVRWYREHPEWVSRVRSGAYLDYYRQMYEERAQTLSRLSGPGA